MAFNKLNCTRKPCENVSLNDKMWTQHADVNIDIQIVKYVAVLLKT